MWQVLRALETGAVLLVENLDEEMDEIIEQVRSGGGRGCIREVM